jgi:hypothetical protein
MRCVMEQPDPNENLLERVLPRDKVQKAWKRVKANKGIPGVDSMSIDDFPGFARAQWGGSANHHWQHLPTFAGQACGNSKVDRR